MSTQEEIDRLADELLALRTRVGELEEYERPRASYFAAAQHALVGSAHTAAGLTIGQPLRATSATTFGFGALDLANANAITGTMPVARLGTTQVPTFGAVNLGGGSGAATGGIDADGQFQLHAFSTSLFGAPFVQIRLRRGTTEVAGIAWDGGVAVGPGIYTKPSDDALYIATWNGGPSTAWADIIKFETGQITALQGLVITEAKNIVLGTTTGTKIGTATTQKLGFFNATPIVRPAAYTQTYGTASRTHANPTATAPTAYAAGANGYSTAGKAQEMRDLIAALVVDVANIKQVLNSVIDDDQALGFAG